MVNYYPKAIEVLSNENLDFRTVLYKIATAHPKVIVDAVSSPATAKDEYKWHDLENEVRELCRDKKYAVAVKLWQEKTGVTYTAAKDAVDRVRTAAAAE